MKLLSRFLTQIILLILLVLGGSFAFHNSHNVPLNLWMFGNAEVPLWILMFAFLSGGFILALIISRIEVWQQAAKRRKAEKAAKKAAKEEG